MVIESPKKPLYLSDVMTGICAVLGEMGVETLDTRGDRLHKAFVAAYPIMQSEAAAAGLNVRFRLSLGLHGLSGDVDEELDFARRRGIFTLDHPDYTTARLQIGREDAQLYLKDLPGNEEMYRRITDKFVEAFRDS